MSPDQICQGPAELAAQGTGRSRGNRDQVERARLLPSNEAAGGCRDRSEALPTLSRAEAMNLCRQTAIRAATARRLTFGKIAISAAAGVLTVLLVTLLPASPTHAGTIRALTGSITGAGASLLSNPNGVAADSTAGSSAHDIYVTDPENHRVEKFGPSGNFILSFGKGVDQTTGGDVALKGAGTFVRPEFRTLRREAFRPQHSSQLTTPLGEGVTSTSVIPAPVLYRNSLPAAP